MTAKKPQRRYPRVHMPLLVQYRFSPMEEYHTDYSADMSRGGMFIYSEKPRPVGSLLYIQFITRDGARIIRGQGRIVRTVEDEGSQQRCGQAVEFINFDAADTKFLEQLVQEYLEQAEKPKKRVGRRSSSSQLEAAKKES